MLYVVYKDNTSIGCTDRKDQNENKYRISMRTKILSWPLFSWAIDVTIQNAWLLFRASYPNRSLLEFRRHLARCLVKVNGTARYNQDTAIIKRSISKDLRLSEQRYLVDNDLWKNASRCKAGNTKTQVICTTSKLIYM